MKGRPLLVPEVIQTSGMDCGPSAVKALLDAYAIPVNFEALRERCQTEVDGTSIDDLEIVARGLGLDAEQIMLPVDYLVEEALAMPAIVVTRQPSTLLHFVVVWNMVGPWVQIMDPAAGRRWLSRDAFLATVFDHRDTVSAARWCAWASGDGSAFLEVKMAALGIDAAAARTLLDFVAGVPGWVGFATLDAAIRMTTSLVASGAVRKGNSAAKLVVGLLEKALASEPTRWIPEKFWSALPSDSAHDVTVRGAVMLRIGGPLGAARTARARTGARPAQGPHRTPASVGVSTTETARAGMSGREAPSAQTPREMVRGVQGNTAKPQHVLWSLLALDGPRAIAVIGATIVAAAVVSIVDALALRGIFQATQSLGSPVQRLGALLAILLFAVLSFALDLPVTAALQRMGRGLECRLRAQLLEKLPKLEDRYVSGRPTSDFTARAHAMHVLRGLPELIAQTGRSALTLLVTAAAIAWIHPASGLFALVASAVAVGVPFAIRRFVTEQSLRLQTHGGALSRFYLDALKGLAPIRAHGAERAITREHEGLLVEWARTGHTLQGTLAGARALSGLFTMAIAVGLVVSFVAGGGDERALLLIVYWALQLPHSGQELAGQLGAYPAIRNAAARLFEPLGAPEIADAEHAPPMRGAEGLRGVHVELRGVTARAMGHTVLDRVHLAIEAGEHVAIVGSSGAGKSSLIALLLGWIEPSEGEIHVDGQVLAGAAQAALRDRTAWVDPAVHLWSGSIFDNVMYGSRAADVAELPRALRASDLEEVLERTPGSLQATLGEGGTNVSGGQGQRVRFARASMRKNADLVLLDEAFRGLDRERRRVMLARARKLWKASTLLLVTHDVSDAKHFDRVLVVDGGRIVEDGAPTALLRENGKFRELLDAEVQTRSAIWGGSQWQRVRIDGGRVVATEGLEVPR